MAKTTMVLPAPPERVFAVLEDPTTLAYFVVGSRTIRHFDPRWPDLHTAVHHTVGVAPLVLRDSTEVVEVDPPTRLVLEARARPFGTATVDFQLHSHPEGTELVVDEYPIAGPMAWPGLVRVIDAAIAFRNREMGRRLLRLVESREDQRRRAEPDG
jgi:uncharacterized protein YndB with AHSA1/START domain